MHFNSRKFGSCNDSCPLVSNSPANQTVAAEIPERAKYGNEILENSSNNITISVAQRGAQQRGA